MFSASQNLGKALQVKLTRANQWVQVNPYGVTKQQKSTGRFLCFLLVTRTGLEPMLPP